MINGSNDRLHQSNMFLIDSFNHWFEIFSNTICVSQWKSNLPCLRYFPFILWAFSIYSLSHFFEVCPKYFFSHLIQSQIYHVWDVFHLFFEFTSLKFILINRAPYEERKHNNYELQFHYIISSGNDENSFLCDGALHYTIYFYKVVSSFLQICILFYIDINYIYCKNWQLIFLLQLIVHKNAWRRSSRS